MARSRADSGTEVSRDQVTSVKLTRGRGGGSPEVSVVP